MNNLDIINNYITAYVLNFEFEIQCSYSNIKQLKNRTNYRKLHSNKLKLNIERYAKISLCSKHY